MKNYIDLKHSFKIAIVFVMFTSLFSLISRLNTLLSFGKIIEFNIDFFLKRNVLWLMAVIIMIFSMGIFIKKIDGKFDLSFLHNTFIRVTSGVLITIQGIINITMYLPLFVISISASLETASRLTDYAEELIRSTIFTNSIPMIASVLQILFGLYFVFSSKKYKEVGVQNG